MHVTWPKAASHPRLIIVATSLLPVSLAPSSLSLIHSAPTISLIDQIPDGLRTTMAANTRYEPAPQRDSFEDRPYTQAPPSYQAADDFATEPRSEGDNVPDDFKVCLLV
jgi:hypothetical protein